MRGLLQRVHRAAVTVDGDVVGEIGRGVALLVGVTHDDDAGSAERLAGKVWGLRIMPSPEGDGVGDVSVADAGGEVLVVSQFTLYGDTRRGRRPSWTAAARPEQAEPLVEHVATSLEALGARVARGRFGADMDVSLVNHGPVTLLVEV